MPTRSASVSISASLLIAILISMTGVQALAQESKREITRETKLETNPEKQSEKQPEKRREDTVRDAGSQGLRPSKSKRSEPSEPVFTRHTEPPVRLGPIERPTLLHPFSVGVSLGVGIPAPIKYGLNVGYLQDPNWSWEASYFTGGISFGISKINVGGFDEGLLTASGRYSPWAGSFNWIFGISHHSYHVRLGNAIVSRLTGVGKLDVLDVQTVGLQAGVGNRWRLGENFTIGVDWFVVDIPLTTVRSRSPALEAYTNESDRREVEEALDFMKSLWTANFLKTTLAFSF